MVRNCIAKLQRDYGKHNLAFATYTLPELLHYELRVIQDNWAEINRQLMQAIARDLEAADIKAELVYVNEIQKERYQRTGDIVPHIHAVFQSRKSRYHEYAISKERNTEIWNRVVSNVLGRRIEIPSGASIQQIKKSAEHYMSKYMSKGGKVAQRLTTESVLNWMPKSWWGATLALRNWVKANCRILSEQTKQFIRDNYKKFHDNLEKSPFSWLYVHAIKLTEPDSNEEIEKPVAIVGRVRKDWIRKFEYRNLSDWNWV
jgi:inorganic triphosphatase YgiF